MCVTFLFIKTVTFFYLLELKAFLMLTTGKLKVVPTKRSILVECIEGADTGAIVVHTCSGQILFPRGAVACLQKASGGSSNQ